jgi:hypothetical protein
MGGYTEVNVAPERRHGAPFNALSAVVVATISEADRDTIIVSAPGGLVDVAQPTAVCTWTRHAATGGG